MNPGTVQVEVTADDIRNGTPSMPRGCAMALAARRALDIQPLGDDDLLVATGGITLYRGYRTYRAWTVPGFTEFVQDFDAGRTPEPAVFTLTFE